MRKIIKDPYNIATFTQEQKDEINEKLKYTCAKQIYRKRLDDKLTPKSVITTSKKKKKTWAKWFESKFGECYYEYINRKIGEKNASKEKSS